MKVLLLLLTASLLSIPASAQTSLPPAIEHNLAVRRAQLLTWSTTAAFDPGQKFGPFDILAASARNGCGGPEQARYMSQLGQMGVNGRYFEMFALTPLVRYLYMFPQCLSEQQRRDLIAGLTAVPREFTAHGTMNHMVLQETSWYLLAQYFPEARWVDNHGAHLTSPEIMARIKDRLTRRHWRTFQSGMFEMYSSTYALTNLYPILNLIDYAKDPEVVSNAAAEATFEVLALKANNFHGTIMPPFHRRNYDQWNAPMPAGWEDNAAIAQQVLWYYFGEPQIGAADLANKSREPLYAVFLSLSAWRPPAAAWSMPAANYRVRTAIPDFAPYDTPTFPIAYGDTWIGRDYAIGSGDQVFNPGGYNDNHETFAVAFRSDAQRNLIECRQPFWKSNSGEDIWNADADYASPFLQSWRLNEHSAVLLANIPEKDPWPNVGEAHWFNERNKHYDALLKVVECRVPKAVDETVIEDHWAFFRKGNVSIAVGTLAGSFEQATSGLQAMVAPYYTVLKVRQAKTALYFLIDDKGGDFAAFQRRARALAPRYDGAMPSVTAGATTVRFSVPAPDLAHPKYWTALPAVTVEGKAVLYQDSPVLETPSLTLAHGVLRVTGKDALEIHGPERPAGVRASD